MVVAGDDVVTLGARTGAPWVVVGGLALPARPGFDGGPDLAPVAGEPLATG